MVTDISCEDYRERFTGAEHSFIDVREDDEYAEAHIPGARNLPLSEFMARYDEIDEDQPVVLVCNTGLRSAQAADFLASLGYDQVYNLDDGTKGWMRKGYAIETAPAR